jgi:hypothetical protein
MGESATGNPQSTAAAPAGAARRQTIISLLFVALFLLTFTAADLLARSDGVSLWFSTRERAANEKRGEIFVQRGAFFDDSDYLWNNKLTRDDYSKGGVYLFGSSVMLRSFSDWTLPPAERALIHNYAYSAATPVEAVQLARFLIRDRGLLSAGGAKNLVVMGVSYVDLVQPHPDPDYFIESLSRSDVYRWDPENGIYQASRNPAVNLIKTERARARSFVLRFLGGQWHLRPMAYNPAAFRRENLKRMNVNYEPILSNSLKKMGLLLDELNSRHVGALGIILPAGTWNQGIPAHTEYFAKMRALFAEKGIPVIDVEHSVPDNEYSDAAHCNQAGTARVQAIIEKIAVDFLRKSGALPQ